jgi:hypothetical protein
MVRMQKGFALSLSSALFFLLYFVTMSVNCSAEDVTLAWDANSETNLAGYKLYVGTSSGSYGAPVNVGNVTTHTVTGLASGTYYFALTAYNSEGLESGFSNEVTVALGSLDTTAPSIAINSPTTSATYSSSSGTISLAGTASDDIAVSQVTWANDRGGSGTASGTGSWSASITLQSGTNVITVTARDAAGNISTDSLSVTYSPTDSIAPTITITSPTSGTTYGTNSSTLSLGGTSSDNVAVTLVTWSNNRGGAGTASGTTAWTVSGIALQSGSNILTITARDAANNTATDTLTVTYTAPETTPPSVTITSPTSGASYGTISNSITLGGTASDNVAVTQVTWANDRGGNGTASGTTSWTASGIPLQSGINVITVTARDAANNAGTDTLTVTYTACSYSLNPGSITLGAAGAVGVVAVTAPAGCGWTAASNAAWISITSGVSGSGNGTVNYSVTANSTASSRAGSMTIAGQSFVVTQTRASNDINGDGAVNVLDLQILVNVILGVATNPGTCDLNSDGSVNAIDLQRLINAILGG